MKRNHPFFAALSRIRGAINARLAFWVRRLRLASSARKQAEQPVISAVATVIQPIILPVIAPIQHDSQAFKAGSAVAFITPIGAYAGKPAPQDIRALAEQQFQRMEPSRGTTIN